MATLIEALIGQAGNDPAIDREQFRACMVLYDADATSGTRDWIESCLQLTSGQRTELDEICATRPGLLESTLMRSQWVHKISAVLAIASRGDVDGFMSPGDVREQLEVD